MFGFSRNCLQKYLFNTYEGCHFIVITISVYCTFDRKVTHLNDQTPLPRKKIIEKYIPKKDQKKDYNDFYAHPKQKYVYNMITSYIISKLKEVMKLS